MAKTASEATLDVSATKTESGKIPWLAMTSKRTEAVPKHTLFGTALENVDQDSLKDIKGHYIPEGFVKPVQERYPLPQHIKDRIPGREALESSRREVLQQRDLLAQVDQQLKNKSEQALTFQETLDRQTQASPAQSARPSWLTEKDLEHFKDINIVGLSPKGSYNRDKYGSKPQRHNYSLIGDIMAKNNEFGFPQHSAGNFEAFRKNRDTGWGRGRHLPFDLMEKSKSADKKQATSLVDLPPNIRHKFGSRVCDNLLSNKELVDMSLHRQKTMSGPPRPSKKENIQGLPVNLENTYESIGQATRYNIFPGLTVDHNISQTQKEFNDVVHLRRVPNLDEFRYQRDELSIWVEQDVLQKRMENKWHSYFESLPKFSANWDRDAKKPVILAPKPTPKPKPRGKPTAQQKPKPDQPQEEEIVFVTPPLTPPPAHEEIVELPKQFERDNDFWNFYDQQVPR